jgi:Uma2 family endonuclease
MSVAAKPITADELFDMPHHGMRLELVRGELRTMPPAGFEHGDIAMQFWRLAQFVRDKNLGRCCSAETGFRLANDPDTVRAPDFAFVSRQRMPAEGPPKKFFPGAPDLAVEVLSPGDTTAEVDEKVLDWLNGGCRAVWVVDPRLRTVTVYHSPTEIRVCTSDGELADDTVVPGFRCKVSDLFAL